MIGNWVVRHVMNWGLIDHPSTIAKAQAEHQTKVLSKSKGGQP